MSETDKNKTRSLVLALSSGATDLELAGGKGESLGRLAADGLPVPAAFIVTTHAYRRFLAQDELRDRLQAIIAETDPGAPGTLHTAEQQIAALFAEADLPEAVEKEIRDAYGELGRGSRPVAVRSSATAEDLPGMSFAGQHESYLNIRGDVALLEAVRRCWASLWTARAIGYRAERDIGSQDLAIAVVVQKLVPAQAAGVMFTADPTTGIRRHMVINASWGLGEAVVGGKVTPDSIVVDKMTGRGIRYQIGGKALMTVLAEHGTREEPTPEHLRTRAVLDAGQIDELARLGVRIETLYGTPMDIEWALHDGRLFLLQARPATGLPGVPGGLPPDPTECREEWNDSKLADYLWTRSNFSEAAPSVMTPATWSLFRSYFVGEAWMGVASIHGHPAAGNIAGRCYANLSTLTSVSRSKAYMVFVNEAFGPLREDMPIPPLPVARRRVLWSVLRTTPRFRRALRPYVKDFAGQVETVRRRCGSVQVRIRSAATTDALVAIWHGEVDPLLRASCRLFAAGGRQGGLLALTFPRWLRKHGVSGPDLDALRVTADPGALESLGPVLGLERLRQGRLDRETYALRWGHRCPDEFEVSATRPAEDEGWIDQQLAAMQDLPSDVLDLLARQEEARREAVARFEQRHPRRVRALHRRLANAAKAIQGREAGRSEVNRAFWVARGFWLRAGELTGHGEDLFFLSADELLAVLGGDEAALAAVPARRAAYEHYRSLPPLPVLIRGRIDPEGWAADPDRRLDAYDEHGRQGPANEAITGFPGSAGQVEGTVRVLGSVAEGRALRTGEILVTSVTNVGWTPLFPRAAAVVTDMGAPLSHAAIVARELGIPAVVGCGNATTHLRDGDRVMVDGAGGTVTVLERARASQEAEQR